MNYFQCFVFMAVKYRIHKAGEPDHKSEDSASRVVWQGLGAWEPHGAFVCLDGLWP